LCDHRGIEDVSLRVSIGIDEVGVGALAGGVVAAVVVLDKPIVGLRDSKKLSANRRATLAAKIQSTALYWAIAQSGAKLINRHGIARCHKDCIRAVATMVRQIYPDEEIILDGNTSVTGIGNHKPIVKADETVPAVSAASIIAKVHRDNFMIKLAESFPRYGWERNKGYGTQEHLQALETHGVTEQHRKGYKPVREVLLRRL